MKQNKNLILFLVIAIIIVGSLSACAPQVVKNVTKRYPALDSSTKVIIINVGETIPFKYEELGSVKLGDAGMTGKSKCTYEVLLAIAIEEARKVGGNAIKIVEHTLPRVESYGLGIVYHQCHSLFVLILKTNEVLKE
ncbi:MAG: hypothetical protein FWC34_06675 [Bacteroidetes bacterium]|nr:hypothetical protein [Bacteroidota bacterium]MCL2301757.1 hypothetical protein [Lentimicrobiaceae bacterium]